MTPVAAPVAIVAGASGGIGSATIDALVARGYCVAAAAPHDALLDALAARVAPHADRVLVVPTDITRAADVEALVARTLVRFGRIDALANVAGVGSPPSLAESDDALIERVLAVNLLGAARTIRAVLPVMRAQRRGAIVNIGSIAGEVPVMGIYSASKFGLRGLNDSVRREVRQYGISVTLIEPGFVATPMNGDMRNLPPPSIVADAVVAAIERPRRVRIVPRSYAAAVFAFKYFPAFADAVFGNPHIQAKLNAAARAERAAAERT